MYKDASENMYNLYGPFYILFLSTNAAVHYCHIKGKGYTFRGDNSVKIVFVPFCKEVYSIRKEFAPRGSKFFPYREDPLKECVWHSGNKMERHKIVSLDRNGKKKSTKVNQKLSPL